MLKSMGTEFKVGVFAIVALATLGYMFFVLSPDTFRNTDYNTYYTVLRNAAGIVPKTHVKTSGVSIGKVKSVALEGNETRIVFEVDTAVNVPTGSRVEIRSVGLLGDVHLEVVRGEDKGQHIKNGGFIPQSEGAADMQALMAMLGDIGKDVKKVTGTLANVLGSEKGEESVQNIVDNIEGLTADLRSTSMALKNVIGTREGDLNDIITNVKNAVADLRQFSGGLRDVLNQDNKDRIDRILTSFDETMVDVKGSAKNINLISEKVEKGEGTIGRLVNDDQALVELEGAIKDIRRVLAPATKLQVEVDYHSEFRRDETSQHFFNVLLRTRPDRFYLIGLTDTTYDTIETKTSSESSPGNVDASEEPSVTTTERIRTQKSLRFNLQMSKRWYFAALRFGLFETTGGLAADMYFLRDKVRLTAEAFDWNTQDKTIRRNAHLKVYASVLFYNHVYVMAGVDDPTRTDPVTNKANKKLNYFAGAGLSFTDDDLKAVLGTAALVAQ